MKVNFSSHKCLSLVSIAVASLVLAGCGGGGGGNGNSGGGSTGTNSGSGGTLSLSVTEANGLTASLSEDKNTVAIGGTVTYTLTLTNTTASAVSINASSAAPSVPPASLAVRDPSGNAVFSPVPGPPPIDTFALAPGQSLTSTQVVSAFNSSGNYAATVTFFDSASTNVGPLAVTVP